MAKIKLMDVVVDPTMQVREVTPYTVSKYAQAMRAGAKFPPLLLEKGTNRIVCGNHRYYAHKSTKKPEDLIDVSFQEFENEAALIRCAAKDNATHGEPLSTWDKKRISLRLSSLGDTPEDIAALLAVPVSKVQSWGGMTVVVVGNGHKPGARPVKASFDTSSVKSVNVKEYEEHARKDSGVPIKNQAAMITRFLKNGWINTDDEKTMSNLRDLLDALESFFAKSEAA